MARFNFLHTNIMQPSTNSAVFLGFDFGTKNIGVAVGQAITKTATPLAIVHAKNGIPNWNEIAKIITAWQPQALVVGVPVALDGSPHRLTILAREFIANLAKHCDLPVYEAEERLTTKAARTEIYTAGGYKALQDKSIDSAAAVLILEEWLKNNFKF